MPHTRRRETSSIAAFRACLSAVGWLPRAGASGEVPVALGWRRSPMWNAFRCGFTPHRPAMATCSPASAARPARWASAITGTRPARETRFGSSKRRVDLGQPMQQSHLTGAPSDQVMEASATPIVPGQGAPFASTRRPPSHHLRSGSRLSIKAAAFTRCARAHRVRAGIRQ